jgi:dTMP kinase
MSRGKLIVIEGGEGCGKGTQARLLLKKLKQKRIFAIYGREPGGVHVGEEIRTILLDKDHELSPITELFLFEAARAEYFEEFIKPHLQRGTTIVSDRSGLSTLAYQGYAGDLSLDLIERLNIESTQGIKPNLSFILDVPVEKGLTKELQPDRFAAKGLEYHRKVNQRYREIAKTHDCILIPYKEDQPEQTSQEIWEHISKLFV